MCRTVRHHDRFRSTHQAVRRPAEVAITPSAAYGVLDGLFQQALLGYLTGDQQETLDSLTDQVHTLMLLTLSS